MERQHSKETIWAKIWRHLAGMVGIDTTGKAWYQKRHKKPKGDND